MCSDEQDFPRIRGSLGSNFDRRTVTKTHIFVKFLHQIQGDQKVSVHPMITVQKTQKHFEHFQSLVGPIAQSV
jgi:hypothetical protein